MELAINSLLEDIKSTYANWQLHPRRDDTPNSIKINYEMIAEFNENLKVVYGKKYIKILKKGSVWGFIVAVDNDAKFNKGDILKPASFKAPARNHARGNVFNGYKINWTGPVYMGTKAQAENEAMEDLKGIESI